MTANIDANNHNHNHDHGEVRESDEVVVVVANSVGEQCCDSDVVDVLPKINGNKDDVEGSYVFVTGHDDVDDLVESDLVNANGNKPGVEEGLAVSQSQLEEKDNADRQTEASGSRADELNSRLSQEVYDLDTDAKNSDELGVAEGVGKDQESEIVVDNDENNNINNNVSSDNKDREVEKVEALSNEIPMKASGDDQEQEGPSKVSSLESEIKLDMAIEEIPICGDIGNGFPDGSKEHNLETTLNSGTRNVLETEAANGPVFEQQNGESLPADIAHESLLEIAVVTHKKGSPTDLDNEKPLSLSEEAPFEGSKGETGDVLEEHNLETPLSSGDDKALETEVANSPSLEQSGQDLPPGLSQESLLETAVVTEQNVSPTDLDNEKPLNLSEEAPVEGSNGEAGDDLEEHNLETPLNSGGDEVANGPLLAQNGEDLPQKSLLETAIVSEQNGSPTALDQENPLSLSGESPVEVSKGDVVEVLEEHSLETPSSSGGDKAFEMEVANGPSMEENEEHLSSGLAQESLLETAVITEQNGSSENAEGLTSPLVSSDVALETGQSFSVVPVNDIIGSLDAEDVRPENDTGELNQESIKSLDDPCPITNDPELNGPANGVMARPEFCSASNGGEEVVSADAIDVESTILETSPEFGANQHIIFGTSIELQSKFDGGIALKDKDTGVVADGDVDFECVGSDVKSASQEAEDIEGKQVDEASTSSQEKLGQTIDGDRKDEPSTALPESTSEGQNAGVEEVKKRLYYFIRIPWYDDEMLREQIKCAELQVEERTKIRGAIHAKVQTQRVIVKEYADKVQASLTEERAARDLFKSKRQEFDSVQLVISKVKNAQSVEDIHAKIRSMEHLIEHETLPLKEEKQLIREIKQLKQQRDQLSSNMGKQDEVQQALDQKDQIEERLKGLRKELDLLREKLSKAEEVTQTAKKKLNVENDKLNELLYQFRDADSIRQEAYAHFKSLKDRHSEKIERFKGYKNASTAALKLALSKDKEQLQHCIDQVEKLMEVWNRDDDFRKDYIRSNTRSTLRRLGTLDGRSLGPDEEPPVMPDVVVNNRAAKNNSVSLTKITEQEKQDVPTRVEKPDDKSGTKVVERKNQTVKTMKPAKPAPSLGTSPVAISDKDERKEEEREEEEPRRSKEEEELARKAEELARRAEELRKEEEEANLKLQRHLEERAKAKEAMERKKKIADKAQAKAAFRAQKDAEEKEKKREKRAQKKERKKANGTEPRNEDEGGECAPDPSSEAPSTGAEPESEKPAAATTVKRPQKAQQFTKQIRTRSVAVPPPLLRNRGKRRMQPWMWVALAIAVAIVLALFLSWPSYMHWFGF